jgi:outer membrane biosynthesis protein TonB
MAAQAQQAKVLRIGIIQDGKIVQERLIKQGENVLVGESPKNTFVFPKTGLPKAEFPLFVAKGGQYHLAFTEGMKGKISSGGAVVGLDKLRADPSVSKQGGVWRLPLSEQDRGKVGIDNVTVLFQFVPPPPVQAVKPIERMDFRPKWFDEDDPAFFGFLALFSALATVFAVGIYLAPPPPELSFDDVNDRFTTLVLERTKEQKEKEQEQKEREKPDEDLNAERKQAKKKAEPTDEPKEQKAQKQAAKPKNKVDAARQREARKEALRRKMKIARIGTRGTSSSGTTTDAWEDGLVDDLSGLGSGDVAVDGDPSGTRGGSVSTEDIEVDDDLQTGKAGSSAGTEVPALDMSQYEVRQEQGDTFDVEGADDVESVVRKYSGQLQYCYERELRSNPGLGGRVEVRWNIANARVTSVDVISNSTGSGALGQCIASKIRRWRFDRETTGSVTWPFVFRKR